MPLQAYSICLCHTLAFKNLLCRVHVAPKLHFLQIFGHLVTLIFNLWISNFKKCLTLLQVFFILENWWMVEQTDGWITPQKKIKPKSGQSHKNLNKVPQGTFGIHNDIPSPYKCQSLACPSYIKEIWQLRRLHTRGSKPCSHDVIFTVCLLS